MKHLFNKFRVSALFTPFFALLLLCGMGKANASLLYVYNADWQPLTFSTVVGSYYCNVGTTLEGQIIGPTAPSTFSKPVDFRMYQGDCTKYGGYFTLEITLPDGITKKKVGFGFDNSGGLAVTNTVNAYEGTLSARQPNGDYYYVSMASVKPPDPTASPFIGHWGYLCSGVCNHDVTDETSNSSTNQKVQSDTTTKAVTASITGGVEFGPVSAEATVTGSLGEELKTELTNSYTVGQTTTVADHIVFTPEQLIAYNIYEAWQWYATSTLSTGAVITVKTKRYTCTPRGDAPTYPAASPQDINACKGGNTSTLQVTQAGTGTGTVIGTSGLASYVGHDVYCASGTCSAPLITGDNATFTATAASGSTFAGWTGDCAGQPAKCVLTMSVNKYATATFTTIPKYTLTVTPSGTGGGTVSGAGINCGSSCSASLDGGTSATLTATAASGSTFAGWSGDCTGLSPCVLAMGADKNVTAVFNANSFTLTVARSGTGSGTVSGSGISCGSTCSASLASGASATLTATAASGSTFAGWSGDCTGQSTCVLTMSATRNVTATFTSQPKFSLTVSPAGAGSGTVSGSGITCGSTCSASLTSGTSATLTATAATGSTFAGWSGDCTGQSTCTLTMSANRNVTATFSSNVAGSVTQTVNVTEGWNLLGNGLNTSITVATVFGDPALVISVWKWDANTPGWQFYSPLMDAAKLQTYAAGKGFGVLATIAPGEGYWVNAVTMAALLTRTASGYNLGSAAVVSGWNLVATNSDVTPSAFNIKLSDTPPTAGTTPINVTSLWAWDNTQYQWYFYSPLLDSNGGLAAYITKQKFLDFQASKKLNNGIGFWVNRP